MSNITDIKSVNDRKIGTVCQQIIDNNTPKIIKTCEFTLSFILTQSPDYNTQTCLFAEM